MNLTSYDAAIFLGSLSFFLIMSFNLCWLSLYFILTSVRSYTMPIYLLMYLSINVLWMNENRLMLNDKKHKSY